MKKYKLEYWQSIKDAQWYWHIKASHGGKIVSNGEGYARKANLLRFINRTSWINYKNIDIVYLGLI